MNFDAASIVFLNQIIGRSTAIDHFFVFLASYLPFLMIGVLVYLLYTSPFSDRKKITVFCVSVFAAILARFGMAELIRLWTLRPRPYLTQELNTLFTVNEWSFPSGHASFLFALATVVYLYNKKWGVGLLLGALIVSLSRIIVGVHYPSDIAAGILVGVLVAQFA